MREGKLPYNPEIRSIRKPMESGSRLLPGFHEFREAVLIPLANGMVLAEAHAAGICADLKMARVLYERAKNSLFCMQARPVSVSVVITLINSSTEGWQKDIITAMVQWSKADGLSFTMAQSFAQNEGEPQLSVTALGTVSAEETYKHPDIGDALLVAGFTGFSGTWILADRYKTELSGRYAGAFLSPVGAFENQLSLKPVADTLAGEPCVLYPAAEGGIFSALWYFSKGYGLGFTASMPKLPIRQETVEISEFLHVNPYELAADGCCLIATPDPQKVCSLLDKNGISVVQVGSITSKACILSNEDETRCLDRPAQDAVLNVKEIINEGKDSCNH